MEQKEGLNALLCRQQLEATAKKISKTSEGGKGIQRQTISNSSLKHRSNLSHPSRPPPPPPQRTSKTINYVLTKEGVGGEMGPKSLRTDYTYIKNQTNCLLC